MFITFEGLDGSGKTTQARALAAWLQENGYDAQLTGEPGGTEIGQLLRKILLKEKLSEMHPLTEMLLMAADRAQHVQQVIRPALVNNQIVICDRYVDSSVAYQGYGLGLDLSHVQVVNEVATGGLLPDLTFLLDVDIDSLIPRLKRRQNWDRIEGRGLSFMERVRDGYLQIAALEPTRVYRVNASGRAIEDIQLEIRDVVRRKLTERLGI